MFYNFRKNKKAFTLVELIVVIAIIAILGAVVGVTVSTFVDRAKKTAATTPLDGLADKWELKEANDTLQKYIQDLYPDDCTHFYIDNNSKAQLTVAKGAITATFKLYYHDDNCGDWWGVYQVTSGKISKQVKATTNDGEPSGTKYQVPAKA